MSVQKRIKLIFDKIIFKDIDVIKNYKYLRLVALEDLNISIYINCEK